MSLDREIEGLLAVDPSPEFVAKVRQRIAEEPAPRVWWFSWRVATAGTGLAVVVTTALLWPESRPATPAAAPAIAHDAGRIAAAAEPVVTIAPAPLRPRALAPSNRPASPVVVIQRDEAAAMDLLLRRVSDRTLPDMTEALAAIDATGPEWIEIPAVVIDPITPGGEGE